MNKADFIHSGLLELYVLGVCSASESQQVEALLLEFPELSAEVDAITKALLVTSEVKAPDINPSVKPLLMAVIDYTERLKHGETPANPPVINGSSRISDYDSWLNRPDMKMSDEFDEIEVKLLAYTPEIMTAIVWIKHEAPYEIHNDVYEKFLIVEGSCNIVTDKGVHSLQAGQSLTLPLNLGHTVKVTSDIPCKVILQRVAA